MVPIGLAGSREAFVDTTTENVEEEALKLYEADSDSGGGRGLRDMERNVEGRNLFS